MNGSLRSPDADVRPSNPAGAGLALAALLAFSACGGDDGPTEPPPAPTTGSVEVSAATSGDTLDADGYAVTLDGGDEQALDPDGTVTFEDVEEGDHDLAVSGVQVNCAVDGDATQTVSVTAEETTTADFDVACEPALLGRITFTSDRGAGQAVYVMAPDGSGVTGLTDGLSGGSIGGHVSPDGTRIVFTGEGASSSEIFVMDVDGSNLTQLTDNADGDVFPVWSPDGSRIAFVSDREGDQDIFVMDADGTGVTRLTSSSDTDGFPAWSPDGSVIAFGRGTDGVGQVMTVNPDGTGLTDLTDGHPGANGDPAWSPDGSQIAFISNRDGDAEVYVMEADGSGATRVTEIAGLDRFPAWTPDGSRIVYYTERAGDGEIHAIDPDGTGDENLTDFSSADDLVPYRTPAR